MSRAKIYAKVLILLSFFGTVAQAQTTGTIIPNVPEQFFDNNGNPCASCKLYAYVAGTTTALDTYSDSALTTPNTNPITLDSSGRNSAGHIYLAAALYKFVLQTSGGATIWTRDNVSAVVGFASVDNTIMDGRITCISATPVGDTLAIPSNSMYLTNYKGNRIALYVNSTWRIFTFSEVSISVSGDAINTNYDLFAYANGSTVTLERVTWASATVRATNLALQDGVYVKSGDATRRYLGTYRKGASGVLDDPATRYVWNYYNRVRRRLQSVLETTDSWTYTTSSFRQANNSASNQVGVVIGVAEVNLTLRVMAFASNTNTLVGLAVSIGEDSTTTAVSNVLMAPTDTMVANARVPVSAGLERIPSIGYHFYPWLELSGATGTTTWYGDNGTPNITQSGMVGMIEG